MTALLAIAAAMTHLTADGWGAVKIGMNPKQVAKALNSKLWTSEPQNSPACIEMESRAYPGLYFMFEQRRLTRISVTHPSRVTTPLNVGVGTAVGKLHRFYGRSLTKHPKYEPIGRQAEDLVYWPKAARRASDSSSMTAACRR